MGRLIHTPTGVEYTEGARAGKIGRGEAVVGDFEWVEDPAPAPAPESPPAAPVAPIAPVKPPPPPPKRRAS